MLNFIVNPLSLKGKSESFIKKAEERLNREGVEYRFFFSDKKGACTEYARTLTQAGQTKIIAVGGDGTLNEVINGIEDPAKTELGLVPLGTGNDFAAKAKIPHGLAALDLILNTEAKPTDYLECGNGIRGMNIAGMGIDVDITERVMRKKHGGNKGKYFRSLLASLCHYKGIDLEVSVNGETKAYHTLIVVACNGSQFGGGIPICPAAVIDDGKLDLLVVDCPKRIKIPFELMRLMRGKLLQRPIAHHLVCDSVKIVPATPQTIEVDGELFAVPDLYARIVSGKLRMFRG